MSIKKAIYEHLITKRKYNTLQVKYDTLKEELERKTVELNTERRIHLKRAGVWEETLKEQEAEIIKLKRRKAKNVANNKK